MGATQLYWRKGKGFLDSCVEPISSPNSFRKAFLGQITSKMVNSIHGLIHIRWEKVISITRVRFQNRNMRHEPYILPFLNTKQAFDTIPSSHDFHPSRAAFNKTFFYTILTMSRSYMVSMLPVSRSWILESLMLVANTHFKDPKYPYLISVYVSATDISNDFSNDSGMFV